MPKSAITRFTGIDVQPENSIAIHGFYVPQLTTAQIAAIPVAELRNGGIVYDQTLNLYKIYETYTTNDAIPLTTSAWVPLISIPSMSAAQGAFFEAVNTVQGQMYGQSDTNLIRIYVGDSWETIAVA